MKSLLIRADGSSQIGVGHIMRCLALAQAWQSNGGRALFVTTTKSASLDVRWITEGVQVAYLETDIGSEDDARRTVQLARQFSADGIVLDGYRFGSEYQRMLKRANLHVLCIDDYGHTSHYYADWVLNQNMSANESFYQRREPYTRLLLGTRYVLLRKEFSVWCGWQREIVPIAHKVLVTLGGSDPDNVALKVLHALKEANVSDLAVRILVGPMSSNLETLRLAIGDATSGFHVLADATNIPELMAWADVAISAGGSTCWELAFMGVPTLVVILSENQLEVAESLAAKGVVVNLGWHQRLTKKKISEPLKAVLTSAEQRLIWSERARALVDGDGAARVVMELKGEKLRLRKACAQDRRLVWEWANDLSTRAASFSSELIVWDTHIQWFNSKLKDPNCLFLIAVDETDTPVGQIRFDFDANKAVVSITTALTYRGRGFGTTIIQRASIKLFQETAVDLIRAYVKPDNTPSIRAFIKAGYRRTSACVVRGNPAYEFTFQRTDVCLD